MKQLVLYFIIVALFVYGWKGGFIPLFVYEWEGGVVTIVRVWVGGLVNIHCSCMSGRVGYQKSLYLCSTIFTVILIVY